VSVINKVLRDLDHRQAAALTGAATASGGDATARGVSPVGAMDRSARLSRLQVWLVVLAGMTALGVLAWFGMGEMDLRTGSAPQVALSVAVPPAPAPSGSTPAQPADVVAPVAVASHAVASQPVSPPSAAQGEMVLRMEESISARKALDALLSTPVPSGGCAIHSGDAVYAGQTARTGGGQRPSRVRNRQAVCSCLRKVNRFGGAS
jgi:hypothetical protein